MVAFSRKELPCMTGYAGIDTLYLRGLESESTSFTYKTRRGRITVDIESSIIAAARLGREDIIEEKKLLETRVGAYNEDGEEDPVSMTTLVVWMLSDTGPRALIERLGEEASRRRGAWAPYRALISLALSERDNLVGFYTHGSWQTMGVKRLQRLFTGSRCSGCIEVEDALLCMKALWDILPLTRLPSLLAMISQERIALLPALTALILAKISWREANSLGYSACIKTAEGGYGDEVPPCTEYLENGDQVTLVRSTIPVSYVIYVLGSPKED